jgi:hypothetical protein
LSGLVQSILDGFSNTVGSEQFLFWSSPAFSASGGSPLVCIGENVSRAGDQKAVVVEWDDVLPNELMEFREIVANMARAIRAQPGWNAYAGVRHRRGSPVRIDGPKGSRTWGSGEVNGDDGELFSVRWGRKWETANKGEGLSQPASRVAIAPVTDHPPGRMNRIGPRLIEEGDRPLVVSVRPVCLSPAIGAAANAHPSRRGETVGSGCSQMRPVINIISEGLEDRGRQLLDRQALRAFDVG